MGYISAIKMRADVAAAIAAGSDASLLFANQSVPVWLSPITASRDVGDLGILHEADVEAVAVLGAFNPEPNVHDIVEVVNPQGALPIKYWVERIIRDESALHIFLNLEK